MLTLAADEIELLGISIPILALCIGGVIALVSMLTKSSRMKAQINAREESRREIAAYVAEGSMSADDAAKLLAAGGTADDLKNRRF